MTDKIPNEVTIVDKSVSERINLIQQLEEEDKQALFRIIDSMLTKTKFTDFFDKNMALRVILATQNKHYLLYIPQF